MPQSGIQSDGHQKTGKSELTREITKASCKEELHLCPEKWVGFVTHSNMQNLILGRKKYWCSIQKQIYFPSKKQWLIYGKEEGLGKYNSIYLDH